MTEKAERMVVRNLTKGIVSITIPNPKNPKKPKTLTCVPWVNPDDPKLSDADRRIAGKTLEISAEDMEVILKHPVAREQLNKLEA